MTSLLQLLKFASEKGASDIHISARSSPGIRLNGKIIKIKIPPITTEEARRICYSVINDEQKHQFEENKELDFSFEVKGVARFRANYYFHKGNVAGVFRKVPVSIPDFSELGLPSSVREFTKMPNGLVLVTGPTGSGKTTTIASLLDIINQERYGHIVTLEDPIEYMHSHGKCMVSQREIGADSISYTKALKSVVRQDPDYCLIGELRDLESIETALQLAETGHLVFATLHTNSAIQTINRIVSIFPADQQDRVRKVLSFVCQGILSQKLIPSQKSGRVAAFEILFFNAAVRNLVREGKLHQVESMMQVGQKRSGMNTLNQSLVDLVMNGHFNPDEAKRHSLDQENLAKMFQEVGI